MLKNPQIFIADTTNKPALENTIDDMDRPNSKLILEINVKVLSKTFLLLGESNKRYDIHYILVTLQF